MNCPLASPGASPSRARTPALIVIGATDPDKAAAWVDLFAEKLSQQLGPDAREAVAGRLKGLAQLIRSMPRKPPAGTHS